MKTKYLFMALRPTQWVKNLFIFLPLVFGGRLFFYPSNLKTLFAFILFSIAASAVYLINDVMDLDKDKHHPIKRLRPLPSGKITTREAYMTALILGCLSIMFSFILDMNLALIIILYLIFNFVYTKALKEAVILDVFCLGGFFLLRIAAGTSVANVDFSYWMIFMTVLLALFLGFNKRRQELRALGAKAPLHSSVLSKYNSYFIDQMIAVITSSIVVVYMLYTVSERTVAEFGSRHLIYSIPFVYYGIFRYLYILHKEGNSGDPTRILLKDGKMLLNLALWLIVCISVIYFHL
ncbi:MAG: decaprenyl-phosphate phosphoribosyltransferase [Candidatus Omnitrophica bacterium]|nr:decaprenyl-phosphate phosphoribosyltransferase [Candidatus Omnitrophota bacterium]